MDDRRSEGKTRALQRKWLVPPRIDVLNLEALLLVRRTDMHIRFLFTFGEVENPKPNLRSSVPRIEYTHCIIVIDSERIFAA